MVKLVNYCCLLNSHFLIQMLGSKTVYDKYVFYRLSVVLLGTHLENGDLCIIAVDESASFNSCERICKFSDTR
jgi:hypothetical protein